MPTPKTAGTQQLYFDTRGREGGIYASTYFSSVINGYRHKNIKNAPPICTLDEGYTAGIAVDGKGNLITLGPSRITVYQGPGMCGPEVGSIVDQYGPPTDVSSADAVTGKIAVGSWSGFISGANGGIALCSLSAGCTSYLTNPNMFQVRGVAMSNSGDCWASGFLMSSLKPTLTYFKGCSGPGVAATGFQSDSSGSLDIDANGNLVSIDPLAPAIRVYSGCKPDCTLVGGPFPLIGDSYFGRLNKQSTTFAAADLQLGQIDVYRYSPTSLTYWYSFNNGLPLSDDVFGVAYNPRSRQ